MPPAAEPEYVVQSIREVTPEEMMYVNVFDDGFKLAIPRLNDAINRVLTLATGMAGGSLAFLKDDLCTGWGRAGAALLFAVALSIAAVGSMPRGIRPGSGQSFDSIKGELERVIGAKTRLLGLATGFLIGGLFVAIAGATARAIG